MTLTELMQKPSVIEFEDKYMITNPVSEKEELDEEQICCEIPELNPGERIILNAWGSWETFQEGVMDYRRRLGIYSVVSKENGENPKYTFKKEKGFSESQLVHSLLSGNFVSITKDTEGLKYIAKPRYGKPLSFK